MTKTISSDRHLNVLIFGMTIYYQIVLNSAWGYIDTVPLWKYVGYILYGIMLFQLALRLLHLPLNPVRLFTIVTYAGFMVLFLAMGNLSVASVFLIGGFCMLLSVDDILYSFGAASVLALLTVFGLTVAGVLPFYNTDIHYWVFGFKNPNNVGYYFTLVFSLFLVRQWKHPSNGLWAFLIISILIDKFWLHDMTAQLVSFFLIGLWAIARKWPKLTDIRLVHWAIVAAPFILTALTVTIGKLYGRLGFLYKLNNVFTSRPAIWHYYMQQFPLKLLGGNIPPNVTVYRGAFDGAFLYYPLTNGFLVSLVLLVLISLMLHFLLKAKRLDVVCFVLSALAFSFSENAPFFIYSSPLLAIALSVAAPGMSHVPEYPSFMVGDESEASRERQQIHVE